jgi:ABC-type transport system involved in cytochrome bd biosynthesis fused ATPase/permease subunit
MDLIKTSLAYASKQKSFTSLILITFLNNVILGIITAELMISISKGGIEYIPHLIGLSLAMPFMSFVESYINKNITNMAESQFNENELKRYDRLSHSSKNKLTVVKFDTNLQKANNSVTTVIDWGLSTTCHLIGTFISCIWTFIRTGFYVELFAITGIISIAYFLIIRNKQKEFSTLRHTRNEENRNIRSKMALLLPSFQYKERTPEDMNSMFMKIQENNTNVNKLWRTIMLNMGLISEISTIIVIFCSSVAEFMLILHTLSSLNSAVRELTYFLNQFNGMISDYDLYMDLWKGLEYKPEPHKMLIPNKLDITNVAVKKGDFVVTLNSNDIPLSFNLGTKMLIKGATGGGKTTFLDGLTGKLDGVTLSYGNPENYYHVTADMYQDIRENIPSAGVSIRDWFKEETNNEFINDCLSLCFEKSELDRLISALEKSKSDEIPQKHAFDIDLQKILSGGQKSRMCLATRVYEMKKYNKQMLILDEPEQGSDPEMAVKVLQNIFQEFGDKTIVMISHMCECQLKLLSVDWTHRLHVKNGTITKI